MTFEQSAAHLTVAAAVTPGASQTGSKRPGAVGPVGAFPLFARSGRGAILKDLDGNEFIDWYNGNCAVTLGHGHPGIARELFRTAMNGSLLSLPSTLEARAAQRLTQVIPCAEQIRFVKTGSEACAGAARIARMATGRSVIVVVEGQYHGWHDWHCVTKPIHPGVPEFMAAGVRTFTYNDLASLEAVMGCDVAAVMIEPTLADAPHSEFLSGVVDCARRHGALVIFDEMITGGRWHAGGAQAYYGVTPDLATCGKAYGNGVPLAFIAGRADLMVHAWVVSGTFGGDTLGLAACLVVLDELRDGAVIKSMWSAGRTLKDAVNDHAADHGWPLRMAGPDVRPVWQWNAASPVATALLQQELAHEGVLVHPSGWNTSACHTGETLAASVRAVHRAGDRVTRWLKSEDPGVYLRGALLSGGLVRKP